MKGYKRLTNEDLVVTLNYNNSYENMTRFLEYSYSLWNLENSIEKGEIDYVVDKDREIAKLKEENSDLKIKYSELEKSDARKEIALYLLAKAFVELKGYEAFEVSQLAKEVVLPEFLRRAENKIWKDSKDE